MNDNTPTYFLVRPYLLTSWHTCIMFLGYSMSFYNVKKESIVSYIYSSINLAPQRNIQQQKRQSALLQCCSETKCDIDIMWQFTTTFDSGWSDDTLEKFNTALACSFSVLLQIYVNFVNTPYISIHHRHFHCFIACLALKYVQRLNILHIGIIWWQIVFWNAPSIVATSRRSGSTKW